MWLKSTNSSEWWSKVKQFARSTAISSIVGALLGLGDRHLDNLLVDFSTGQVVHVDFNVAYNKGKNLRVPEVVPFRLTRNIVAALGPTKFEV
jgi:PI-3-kinase-related kinase SMG-1